MSLLVSRLWIAVGVVLQATLKTQTSEMYVSTQLVDIERGKSLLNRPPHI